MITRSRLASIIAWLMGPAFVGVAAWLLLASPAAPIPVGTVHLVPLEQIRPGAWRTPLTDATRGVVAGTQRSCNDCHKLFTPSPVEPRTLVQHKGVVLSHGINARCLNCHSGADHEKLVLHDGTLVALSETPRLCSQCHGTVYRDWQRGMHGKTMGSWDASGGRQVRLTCNECHDPHAPAYQPLAPLPGPDTLRMGDQEHAGEGAHKHTPLRQWSQPHERAPGGEHTGVPGADHDGKGGGQ